VLEADYITDQRTPSLAESAQSLHKT